MTTRYSDDYLAALDPEVADLARDQESDDTSQHVPQDRIGRQRARRFPYAYQMESVAQFSPDNTQSMFDEEVDGTEKDLGWMTEAVEQLSPALREAYDLIYVQRLSLRDGAARVGISHVALLYRVQELQKQIKAAAPEGLFDADD